MIIDSLFSLNLCCIEIVNLSHICINQNDGNENYVSSTGEKAKRAIEKKEQFRQVRAHVPKDDGRLRAYGWSLPGNKIPMPAAPPPPSGSSHVPVPVPVYCRPLMEHEPGMKVPSGLIVYATRVRLSHRGFLRYDNVVLSDFQ